MTFRQLPQGWCSNVEAARDEIAWTLQTLSANALELSSLWINGGYSDTLLVDVEKQDFTEQLPMQV
jgi:dynein heavy chain, axonemal